MKRVYHLDLVKKDLSGAVTALLPGDPFRVPAIAMAVEKGPGGRAKELAWNREFRTSLVRRKGGNVLVTSTGIGGPSTSIAIDELARLGVTTFIRVGTTGAIQKSIRIGDVIITTGSVRLDGASTHYAPIEYPAVADHGLVTALIRGAGDAGVRLHAGVTASSDTFYPGEERTDSFGKYTLRRFKGATKELEALSVLNYEMESATVLTMTASMGLRGACITGVVNRAGGGPVAKSSLKTGERNVIRAATAALDYI
jgi:uridine phosphorylase